MAYTTTPMKRKHCHKNQPNSLFFSMRNCEILKRKNNKDSLTFLLIFSKIPRYLLPRLFVRCKTVMYKYVESSELAKIQESVG